MKISLREHIRKLIQQSLTLTSLVTSLIAVGVVFYEFGFPIDDLTQSNLNTSLKIALISLWVIITIRLILGTDKSSVSSRKFSSRPAVRIALYCLFTLVSMTSILLSYDVIQADVFVKITASDLMVAIIALLISISEISTAITRILSSHANPALILAGSFAVIIFLGSMLLSLPNCTTCYLPYIDALLVSTSAVCVTGLTPIDISTVLTPQGHIILMFLIQIGGLGIMTITSFFGLFFAGGSSLSNQIMVKEILSGDSLGGLLRMIVRIIVVTLGVELAGAVAIYFSIKDIHEISNPLFFSAFHAVSAFCNAGFSTLSGNMYDPLIRNIGSVMWIISFLVIFGGIGFPVFSNILSIIWHHIQNVTRRIVGGRRIYRPHLWSLNSYIVLRVTAFLLISSWALFLIFEWNNSLAEFDFWDKLAQGFLCAVTPRTAGFSGVDLEAMLPASIMLTVILMWIGGAPQSTAGGVKVTTVYLAIRNVFSVSTNGKIEAHNRTIPKSSLVRASAIISLSISIICVAVVVLSIFEPNIELSKLIYEVVSAIGTVGLSMGVTPILSVESKVLIILLMYIGRIGVLTTLYLFIRPKSPTSYSYPEENILIN